MPNSAEHRAKYELNRAFLDTGLAAIQPEWAAIVAFYAAVHLIERLAASEPRGPVHSRTHTERIRYLSRHRQHSALIGDYRLLQEASELSRYYTLHSFRSMYTAATVQSQLIDTHLVAIEQYVTAYFPPPPPPAAATGS